MHNNERTSFRDPKKFCGFKEKVLDVYRQNLDLCDLLPCVLEFASKKFTISGQLLEMCRQISDPDGKPSLFRIYKRILAKNLNFLKNLEEIWGIFTFMGGGGGFFFWL